MGFLLSGARNEKERGQGMAAALAPNMGFLHSLAETPQTKENRELNLARRTEKGRDFRAEILADINVDISHAATEILLRQRHMLQGERVRALGAVT